MTSVVKLVLAGLPLLQHIRGCDSSINQLWQIPKKPLIHRDCDTHLRGCVGQLIFHSLVHKTLYMMCFSNSFSHMTKLPSKNLWHHIFPSLPFPRQIINLLSSLIPAIKFSSVPTDSQLPPMHFSCASLSAVPSSWSNKVHSYVHLVLTLKSVCHD